MNLEVQLYFLKYLIFYRLMIICVGVCSIILGYRLFIKGFSDQSNSNEGSGVTAKIGGAEIGLQNAAPGTCFALFGVIIISIMIAKGNPELKLQTIRNSTQEVQSVSGTHKNPTTEVSLTMRGEKNLLYSFNEALDIAKKCELNNQIQEAIKKYSEAIKIASEAMNGLAWLYLNKNDRLDDALYLARVAVTYNQKNPNYKDTLSEILFIKGLYHEALQIKKEAAELDSRFSHDMDRFMNACSKEEH